MSHIALAIAILVCSACYGQSLREAVQKSNIDRVRELLESGADANTSYENRFTPIYFAEDPRIVDLLVEHGAKLNLRDAARIQTPIESAAEKWFRDVKRRDTWKIIVDKLRQAGAEYTIGAAIYMNDISFISDALNKDNSWVNKSQGAQSVPLRLAAHTGRVEICKLLLENKADPDSFEEGNGYPIMVDAIDHPAVVKLLIEHGANLKRRITYVGFRSGVWIIGDEGSALHYAARAGNFESVKLLINAGLDPNAADDLGQTPLHIAIRFERWSDVYGGEKGTLPYMEIIQHLLNNDASLRFKTKSGQTPLDLAKELNSPKEIIQAIRQRQKEIDKAFHRAWFDDR